MQRQRVAKFDTFKDIIPYRILKKNNDLNKEKSSLYSLWLVYYLLSSDDIKYCQPIFFHCLYWNKEVGITMFYGVEGHATE